MKNVFVMTGNVQKFRTAMEEAVRAVDPALLAFYGQAGRGKTTAAKFYAGQEGWVYCRAKTLWSELWMLQDLCFELSIDPIPKRKKPCFEAIERILGQSPRPVLIDEADKIIPSGLEVIRDLADITSAPFALVGENLLVHKMQRQRRIWSRTLRALEFGPIQTQDVLYFAKQAADIALTADQAEQLRNESDGDFRLVSRDVRRLKGLLQTNMPKDGKPTDDMVNLAIKQGFRGK